MYSFNFNGVNYDIEFEKSAYLFADIYVGYIYDEEDNNIGVIMVDEERVILKRSKDMYLSLIKYVETLTENIIQYVGYL